jgi:ketosteroid isomerase-like protein
VSANFDLVRSIVETWERGDFSSVDWADPNIEFEGTAADLSTRVVGVAAMAEAWGQFLGAWRDFRLAEVDEYRQLDHERVLVLHSFGGRGKVSGVQVGQTHPRGAMIFYVRDGRVRRLRLFSYERDRDLADLGLTPEGSHPDT